MTRPAWRPSVAVAAVVCVSFSASSAPSAVKPASEDAYRANNLGVALLEQFDYPAAVEAFKRAVSLDPGLGLARLNLAIALYNARDLEGAQREAQLAARALPDKPHPHYLLGLVAKAENRAEDAIAAFERVAGMDAADVGGNVNLGQMYMQVRRYPDAIRVFRAAVAAEPYSQTAVYNLGIALTRAGERAEGEKVMDRFRELRDSGYRTVLGQNYLEQGRYAEALSSTGAEADLVSRETPAVRFADASSELPAELRGSTGDGQVTLADLDGDGTLDLVTAGTDGLRVWRNAGGRFAAAATVAPGPFLAAVAGDSDNDGKPDLLALASGALALFHNEGALRFRRASPTPAPVPAAGARSAAWSDFDHDGDLDVVAGRLWRNNGDGTFTEVTGPAGLGEGVAAIAIVPTDYDNRRDVDLLMAPAAAPMRLFRNMRDGTFKDVATELGLARPASAVAAGDVNKDEYTDFYLAAADGPGLLALSDGRGGFALSPAAGALAGARAAQFLDYDADGLLDLVALTVAGVRLSRNVGGSWTDVSAAAFDAKGGIGPATALASGDVDLDGDTDLVVRLASGAVRLLRNEGGSRHRSVRVRLTGQVSNRTAVGAKVEARAGSLRQKLETYAAVPAPAPADVLFGLGARAAADAVRVLWPAGILQTETAVSAADGRPAPGGAPLVGATIVTELDRKPSSCPYLYAWDGERFAFVTDFMGGGEMAYRHANGALNHPDPDEYVRLTAEQLRPRGGKLELRVTNELEEVLYVDRLRLLAVAHPAGVEVHPYEGLVGARGGRPFRLFAARDARPPVRAWDDHGHDVRARLERLDRSYPDDFRKLPIRGYAEEHTLTLDLGPGSDDALLLLTGWTDYAFSSDNVAAGQRGLALRPPSLQVKDAAGAWRTVLEEVGIPVGRPQTLVADLRGRWRGSSREVRIVTNMRIYWDRIVVAAPAGTAPLATTTLDPVAADLRWRGFSAEHTPDGREPFAFTYERVSAHSPWKVFPGRYTREGDVRALLLDRDDMFVISRPGDEVALAFDAAALPPLPEGWTRTWLFYSDGYSKEMDVNSGSPDAVEPLPFHAMSRYPYEAPESYPLTPERRAYLETYNTRVVARPVPRLDLASAR